MHIMLDLETWGKRPGCDIRSIGAVVFDPMTGDVSIPCETCEGGKRVGNIHPFSGDCSDCLNTRMERGYGDTFYVAMDNPIVMPPDGYPNEPYRKYSLNRDPETVKWWNDQSPEAQAAFTNPVDLRDACLRFGKWIYSLTDTAWYPEHHLHGLERARVWANDPHFDVSILEAAYHAVGLPVPWHYRAPRSMKTATDLAGLTREEYSTYGEPHNALHDAIAQAMTVCRCYNRLGLTK